VKAVSSKAQVPPLLHNAALIFLKFSFRPRSNLNLRSLVYGLLAQ